MKVLSIVLVLGLCAASAQAAIVAYDGFDYDPGTLSGKGSAADPGWGGSWGSGSLWVTDGTLGYGPLVVTGNKFTNVDPNTGTAERTGIERDYASATGQPNSTVWVAYLVNVMDPLAPIGGWFGSYQLPGDRWFGHNGVGHVGSVNYWGLEKPSSTNSSLPIDLGTHLVVQKLEIGADGKPTKWMWVDPDFSTIGGPDLDENDAILQNVSSNNGNLMTGVGWAMGFEDDWFLEFDEYRIGETYADVTPRVPEPGVTMLLATGLTAVWGLRRRRSRS
jgi:hypothetical protein